MLPGGGVVVVLGMVPVGGDVVVVPVVPVVPVMVSVVPVPYVPVPVGSGPIVPVPVVPVPELPVPDVPVVVSLVLPDVLLPLAALPVDGALVSLCELERVVFLPVDFVDLVVDLVDSLDVSLPLLLVSCAWLTPDQDSAATAAPRTTDVRKLLMTSPLLHESRCPHACRAGV
jgi:hypothetical protein